MRVLFVSHTATRSGAPWLLLQLMRWLRANTNWQLEIALLGGGPLEEEFLKVAQPARLSRSLRTFHQLAAARILLRNSDPRLAALRKGEGALRTAQRLAARAFARQCRAESYDLIYANTAATGHALKLLSRLNCPVLTHVHELDYALEVLGESWVRVHRETDHYIAVSEAVKTALANRGVGAEKIDVVYGGIDTRLTNSVSAVRQRVRAGLGIPESGFLVGGSGTLEWRKGGDLFVQLAHCMGKGKGLNGQAHSLWVGGELESSYAKQMAYDSAKLGPGGRLVITGEVPNPLDYYAALDAFALTSREDPFPLVCLEAAACAVPIVCFAGAGGMPEFVGEECGFVVPWADIPAMAARLLELEANPELRARLGAAGQQRVRSRHDLETVAPAIADVMRRTAKLPA